MQSRSEYVMSSADLLRQPCKSGEYLAVIVLLTVPPRIHDMLEQEIPGMLRVVAG